jgi:hypothetical protein
MIPASPQTSPLRPEAPRYWIRRYVPQREAFVLAPIEGETAEFLVAIDPQSPSRGRMRDLLMDALFGERRGQSPIRLLVRPSSASEDNTDLSNSPADRFFTITDAFQPRLLKDNDARKIIDSGGALLSRWTDALDEAVVHHGQLCLVSRALGFFARMDSKAFEEIHSQASADLPPESAKLLPKNILASLRGEEGGARYRYNPTLPLSLQIKGAATPAQRANYSIQRALIEAFARQVDVGPSALGDAQNELLATGVLVAAHPSRSGPLLRQQTAEAARGIASQILAGLMELNGADAASKEFDELFAPKPDGSFGRRAALHDEVLREMEPHPIAASTDFTQKTAAYLELGLSRLERYRAEAQALVYNEQLKSAGTVKPKRPGSAPEAAPLDQGPGKPAKGKKLGRLLQAGETAANTADHAHKTVVQAETLPWF